MNTMSMSLLGLVSLLALIWVLYEVWGVNKSMSTGKKVIWSIAAFFFNIITAIVYYFVHKSKSVA